MGDFLEAAAAFIDVKKEQIYLNEDIKNACSDFSRILIKQLNERGIELSENEATSIKDDYFSEIVDSLDFIIVAAYCEGFADSTKLQKFIKGLK